MPKIAVVVGSTREGSFNRALGRLSIRALEAQGAEVTDVDLAGYDLPLYSAAIESGAFPADAERLKRVFAAQDGLLFVSPEYNGSVSPLLKNAIDWASRPTGDEGLVALVAYRGKAAAIMSASVSPFGGLRGLIHLRQILSTVQALVIPEQVLIPNAHAAFDESGALKDALPASLVDMTAMRLAKVAAALAA
ncbi:NADPH-dependent FMN reductase [Sphingopyxis terrae]|uniref:NAD(P)H-dependent FMN reductase n=1 Tax=Sphingopyxis terrae subsp. ummariensis TaxID=429001 RepID=A0A1Y6EU57_9SPHN|nr:NAD(P)H-dependent oxidoreductase [Sphingopyxis terrae]PCF92334.1 NADPH-dependent oxidoreductase [Sphingopyxis terrae subsp. ummariensis]SMQ64761.1 NAD(P)H-dependent FMN reductase [Sphingopyxis terrae subsp. ummariensis]